jgi:hemerythrin
MRQPVFPWSDAYALGLVPIDRQHRHLFDLVNRIYALDNDNFKAELKALLHELGDYLKEHFGDEEAYMRSVGFPGYEKHLKIHEEIIERYNTLFVPPIRLDVIKTKLRVMAKKILIDHITEEDVKVRDYVRMKQQTAPDAEEPTIDLA